VVDGADAGVIAKGANVVLAAGSVPRTLPGFDVDGTIVVTSDEFLDLSACRRRRRLSARCHWV